MLIVDASALLVALTDAQEAGKRARDRLRREKLYAPALIDLEVVSALRRLVSCGAVPTGVASAVVPDLAVLPIERVPHARLLTRCWELRDNLTSYDAAYVALAEALDAPLVTADRRLAAAPGVRCRVDPLEE